MSRGRVIWYPPVTLLQRDEDGEAEEESGLPPSRARAVPVQEAPRGSIAVKVRW